MAQGNLTSLTDRVSGYIERVIAPNLASARLIERPQGVDWIRAQVYQPYRRYYSFLLPEEPLTSQSITTGRIGLYVSDLEQFAEQDFGKCMTELQDRASGYKSEIEALHQKGYTGVCQYVDSPLFETTFQINTPTEMHIRSVLTDFLSGMEHS